ncbi:MAG: hypothetical protein JJE55_15695 [Flavobacteriaceae bacterium]|nr:hypothetical protein [Flavobacteriaceae bacterium]
MAPSLRNSQNAVNFSFNYSMSLRIFMVILLSIITAQPLNISILKPNSVAFAYDIKFLLTHNPLATLITICVVVIFLLPIHFKYRIRKLGEFYEKKALINKLIIKDDYGIFKDDFQQIMEQNISKYNKTVWTNLEPHLEKLKEINPKKYHLHFAEIKKELAAERISKYEYWADPPYRTIRKTNSKNALPESDLLNQIHTIID